MTAYELRMIDCSSTCALPIYAGGEGRMVHEHDGRHVGARRERPVEPVESFGVDLAVVVAVTDGVDCHHPYRPLVDDVLDRARARKIGVVGRSEERRVGTECVRPWRSRWLVSHVNKKEE